MEENKKISFFKRMVYSIKDFEKYQIFAFEKLSQAIKYLLKFVIIYTVIVAISIVPFLVKEINSGIEYLKNEMPDFEFKDNKLSINTQETITLENKENSVILLIDTNIIDQTKIDEYTNKISGYSNGIILLNDRMIYIKGTSINTNIVTYEQLSTKIDLSDFTKQTIIDEINKQGNVRINIYFFIILFIQVYVTYFIQALVIALEIGLFGFIIARISGLKLKFLNCYNIAIYSLTLSTILSVVAVVLKMWMNFEISYFDTMYMLISYIYVITAILMIKSDLIKRHIELITIQAQIQQQIEEKRREKEETKEEEKKDENEKQDDKKDEKNDGDENVGKEAKGEA